MSLTFRQKLAGKLRKIWLLPLADFVWFLKLYISNSSVNKRFLKDNPDAKIPPPFILYDILGACDISGFFQSGKEHALAISDIIHQQYSNKPLRILEWGCGPARVLQFLQPPEAGTWDLCGSDYNARTIDWCRHNLQNITFLHNDLTPPLMTDAESFDVVYCISVFTHLSESLHHQWINEIFRLLKPGGLFIGTFHGTRYRKNLTDDEQKRFDNGQLVVRDKIRVGKKNYAAYQSNSFVDNLLSQFTSAWYNDANCFQQTVWCAIKSPLYAKQLAE